MWYEVNEIGPGDNVYERLINFDTVYQICKSAGSDQSCYMYTNGQNEPIHVAGTYESFKTLLTDTYDPLSTYDAEALGNAGTH